MKDSLFQKYDSEIIRRYKARESVKNIAKDIGCCLYTLYQRLKVNNIPVSNPTFREHDNEIIKRYNAGDYTSDIANDIGCSNKTVLYRLKVNGIERKTISEALCGRPKSKEHIEKMKQTKIRTGMAKGSRNPNWKGGIQDNWSKVKNSREYKIWRKSVFEKDNYTCQGCGYAKGHIIEAHHILRRVDFPHLIFAINNGITLCEYCHRKVHSRGANHLLGELLGNPTVKSGIISSRALYIEKVQRLCTQPEREDIVRSA